VGGASKEGTALAFVSQYGRWWEREMLHREVSVLRGTDVEIRAALRQPTGSYKT